MKSDPESLNNVVSEVLKDNKMTTLKTDTEWETIRDALERVSKNIRRTNANIKTMDVLIKAWGDLSFFLLMFTKENKNSDLCLH